jgi:4-amino-4-deoxy-L-arabinose transferase-like glycosyltransferase
MLVGLWMSFSLQTFIPLVFISFIIMLIWSKALPKERRFLIIVLSIALCLRVILLFSYYNLYLLPGNVDILGPDGESYQCRGWYISRLLVKQNLYVIPSTEQIFHGYRSMINYYKENIPSWNLYQVGIFSYLIASAYAAFGYAPLMIKLTNCIFSVLTGLIVYFLGKEIFNRRVGSISMIIFLFLPSIVFVSITALKDPSILFFSMLIIWSLLKMRTSLNFRYPLFILFSLFLLYFLRKFVGLIFLVLVGISFLSFLNVGILKKVLIVILTSLLIFNFPIVKEIMHKNLKLEVLTNIHVGYAKTLGGHNYKIFPDNYYQTLKMSKTDFFLGWLKGIFHFLFEPLPWNIRSKFELLSFLQNIFWYFLFIFVLLGIIIAIRNRFPECIPALIYIFIFTMAFGLSEGNIGTAFRHRDSLNPIFIIFGIAGLKNFFGKLNLHIGPKIHLDS